MATIKTFPNGTFQLRVENKLLGKPFYATFDTREDARAYGERLEGLLAQGIVPTSLLQRHKTGQENWTIGRCLAEYLRENSVPLSDQKLLNSLRPTLAHVRSSHVNYEWAEAWVRDLKRTHNLAPSTVRHRHGALARCFDWMVRKHPGVMAHNPLRQVKRGFATYSDQDKKLVQALGKSAKRDIERDRRLLEEEEAAVMRILETLPDERALFVLALESAMRMRECYTLHVQQVSLSKRTIHLEHTKNGDSRQVPLTGPAMHLLRDYLQQHAQAIQKREGRLFPFWNGVMDASVLDATTRMVSRKFRQIFASAGVTDFHFHDLRHEATCRLYERTTLSDVLIARITGHRSLRMLMRYASLRGSDLASRLW